LKTTFSTTLHQAEGMNATGIQVPEETVTALGKGKRPPVKVTVNGYTYRSTVAPMGDVFMISFAAEHRAASGIQAGDAIEVTLELDEAPRTVEVPADLATALEAAGLRAAFDASAPSKRKEFVRQVEEAKTDETRQRRIAKVVAGLTGNSSGDHS
jgi:hypothetical protein